MYVCMYVDVYDSYVCVCVCVYVYRYTSMRTDTHIYMCINISVVHTALLRDNCMHVCAYIHGISVCIVVIKSARHLCTVRSPLATHG
jgi:hypothetical protein